jgi:predicted enzyme related to lactoylglutathione lyase
VSEAEANPLATHGKISYIEIPANNLEQSASFYETVFGWQIDRRENGDRTFMDGSGTLLGRWLEGRPISAQPSLLVYIYVDGISEVVRAIEAAGGAIVQQPRPEGDLLVGRFRDPAGNLLGIWEFASSR